MSTASDAQSGTWAGARPRDPRLDFFRGIGMFIILIAHVPWNTWANYIPARFGFSDATEIFVFCSGMASAIAFGRVFDSHGLLVGTGRILLRVWQVYWAQIAIVLAIAALMVAAGVRPDGVAYVDTLNLGRFFAEPMAGILGLVTLTYVPNYFDILPMYLVILALVPVVMTLSSASPAAALAFVAALWIGATLGLLDLPAEPWSDRPWFFNPFAWQLVFFTGFALMRGWLPAPPIDRRLVWLSAAAVALTVPFAWHRGFAWAPALGDANAVLAPLIDKTRFGILRYVHFLALAYLAYASVGSGQWLEGVVVDLVRRVGQQSLAVFLASLFLAQLLGMMLDRLDHDAPMVALANLLGVLLLVVVAQAAHWFKTPPWRGGRRASPPFRADAVAPGLARNRS